MGTNEFDNDLDLQDESTEDAGVEVGMSDEQKAEATADAEVDAKKVAKKAKKKENKENREKRATITDTVMQYIRDNADSLPAELTEGVSNLDLVPVPAKRERKSKGTGQVGKSQLLKKMIMETGSITLDKVFADFRMGITDTKRAFYNLRKKVKDPAEWIWVSFNTETEVFELKGTGETEPEGFSK